MKILFGTLALLAHAALTGYRLGRGVYAEHVGFIDLHDPIVTMDDCVVREVIEHNQAMARQIGDIGERLGLGRDWDPDEDAPIVQRGGDLLRADAEATEAWLRVQLRPDGAS